MENIKVDEKQEMLIDQQSIKENTQITKKRPLLIRVAYDFIESNEDFLLAPIDLKEDLTVEFANKLTLLPNSEIVKMQPNEPKTPRKPYYEIYDKDPSDVKTIACFSLFLNHFNLLDENEYTMFEIPDISIKEKFTKTRTVYIKKGSILHEKSLKWKNVKFNDTPLPSLKEEDDNDMSVVDDNKKTIEKDDESTENEDETFIQCELPIDNKYLLCDKWTNLFISCFRFNIIFDDKDVTIIKSVLLNDPNNNPEEEHVEKMLKNIVMINDNMKKRTINYFDEINIQLEQMKNLTLEHKNKSENNDIIFDKIIDNIDNITYPQVEDIDQKQKYAKMEE